jgi:hypothetical protein
MSNLVCSNGVDQLMDYLEDAVPPAVRVALDDHVAGCQKCVAFIASYWRRRGSSGRQRESSPPRRSAPHCSSS